jgi:hypothetical protein
VAFYFQRLDPPDGLGQGYVALLDAMDTWELRALAASNPTERVTMLAKREELRRVLEQMWKSYDRLGVDGPRRADQIIRRFIRQTAVRPPTSGRLESGILSRALPTAWPAGAIGVADIERLDLTAVNPNYHGKGKKSYWRAQEYGYSGAVGRIVPGFFMPGRSRPSAAEFRNHPYFERAGVDPATGKSPKGTPAMVITKPIRARHFLRDGTAEFIAWREREMSRINRTAINRMANI